MKKQFFIFDNDSLQFKKSPYPTVKRTLNGVIVLMTLLSIYAITTFTNVHHLKKENASLKQEHLAVLIKINDYEQKLNSSQLIKDSLYREFLDMPNINSYIRNPNIGGVDNYANIRGYSLSDRLIKVHKRIDRLIRSVDLEYNSLLQVSYKLDTFKTNILNTSIPSISPIKKSYLESTKTSPFGMRLHPILKFVRLHAGVDISAKEGTGVYATADGVVERASFQDGGLGNNIVINHENGYKTVYAHLSSINVVKGQKLKIGDIIGLVGSTGLSTVNHLHYEVRVNNTPVNPEKYFRL